MYRVDVHCWMVLVVILVAGPVLSVDAGKESLLVIEPGAENPRNSEGDIIELKDGRLCLIYTRFTGGRSDHSAANLARRTSHDGGKSWSDDQLVVRHTGGLNVMSVSLLRLTGGEIALFYLRKTSRTDCRIGKCVYRIRPSSRIKEIFPDSSLCREIVLPLLAAPKA